MLQINNQPSFDYYLENDQLLERHEASKPPKEAYLFIPNDLDLILFNENNPKKTLRRIFEMKYKDYVKYEKERMNELDKEIQIHNEKNKNQKLIFPHNYNISEKFRLHQATGYRQSKTIELLIENIKWRASKLPPIISSKVVELLNCGFIYIHGRDINFRPIKVINVIHYLNLKEKYIFEDWMNCIIYFMEYSINNLLIPGQIENWDIIMDVTGINLIFLPSDLKKLIGILQSNYRCRLFVNFIIGMSTILKGIWSFVSSFLDESTVKKIRFLNNENKSELFAFINQDQIEKRFGGKANDIIPGHNNCFPPIFPNNKDLFDPLRSRGRILSEEEYKEMHLNGLLATTCPYFLDKWRNEQENSERLKFEQIEIRKKQNEEINKKINHIDSTNIPGINFELTNSKSFRSNSIGKINLECVENEYTHLSQSKMKELKRNLKMSNKKEFERPKLNFFHEVNLFKGKIFVFTIRSFIR
jgi:hypothetical protein